MKEALKRAEVYDLKGFLSEVEPLNEVEFDLLIERYFSLSTPHLYPNDPKKRNKRSEFFSGLMKYSADSGFPDSYYLLEKKIRITSLADSVADEIKQALNDAEISKKDIDTQFWSHIRNTEREMDLLEAEAKAYFDKQLKAEGGVTVGSRNVRHSSGLEYDTDYATEQKVKSLSLTFSMLGFENNRFIGNKLEIGGLSEPSEDEINSAVQVQNLAVAWGNLEDTASRAMMFSGDAYEKIEGEVQQDARDDGIKHSYHFEPEYSPFEAMDFISSHRVIEANTQAFFDAILNNDLKGSVVDRISQIRSIDDGKYLSENEICALLAFSQQYGADIFTDTKTCEGLTIREWLRGYSCLIYLSKGSEEATTNHCYTLEQLIGVLKTGGLGEGLAYKFISLVTFGPKSRDLYDCPLLKMSGDYYYLFYKSIQKSNVYFILSSLLSSLEFVYEKKGANFEDQINNKLIDNDILARTFKFKRGNNEEYEYDSVFIMEKRVFVVECKNRSLPCWNPVRGARFKQLIDDTTKQVKRLVSGLTKYPEVFKAQFNQDIADFEVVPLIMWSLPFAYLGVYEGVFISDSSSFGRFFEFRAITFKEYGEDKKGPVKTKNIRQIWEGDKPTSDDLLEYLDRPIQLNIYLNTLKAHHAWFKISEEAAFTISTLNVDYYKGLDIEFGDSIGSFRAKPRLERENVGMNKKKSKALVRKEKSKNQKKSRRKNRRKK